MGTLIYNSTSFLTVTLSPYGKAFGLPDTPFALLILGVTEAVARRLSTKKVLLEILQIHRKKPVPDFLFN